ncbi:MAG: glycosyltransferase [Euryarchaeota archaeon]|nr:glycosyltransferase [Euryarchaeota archaeon]
MADLRVLVVQNQLCSRAWRHAKVLSDAGVEVSLFETGEPSEGYDYSFFDSRHTAGVGRDLRSVVLGRKKVIAGMKAAADATDADVIHSNNGPDHMGAWAARHLDVPLLHDVHDLWSATPVTYVRPFFRPAVKRMVAVWEKRAVEGADLVLTVSDGMKEYLERRHQVGRSRVVGNKSLPQKIDPKPKLSARDGKVHVVYAGGINTIPGSSRDFLPGLERLTSERVMCHIYPITFTPEDDAEIRRRCDANPYLVRHDPVPYEDVIPELTQYDHGYLFYDTRDENILIASPTKLFQYILAGLPVIVQSEGSIGAYVREKRCGIVADSLEEAAASLEKESEWDLPASDCVLDAKEFLGFYDEVLSGR